MLLSSLQAVLFASSQFMLIELVYHHQKLNEICGGQNHNSKKSGAGAMGSLAAPLPLILPPYMINCSCKVLTHTVLLQFHQEQPHY